jgi:hypothetical protein
MIPSTVRGAVNKALYLLPHQMHTPEARVMLYAIGLQESRFEHRRQLIKKGGELLPLGPAKGLWQFERGGGCAGVVSHPASRYWMNHVCQARGVPFNATAIWNALEHDDVLAAGCARLLLFTDPKKLPALGDESGAWNLYIRTWRPGKPHRATWPALYAEALAEVMA